MSDVLELARKLVPHSIKYEEIVHQRNFRQVLHLRLFNNTVYLLNGMKGEPRHFDIVAQLMDLKDTGYVLPNVEFKYYTMDTVTLQDTSIDGPAFAFWDDEVFGNLSKRILAPSCWFNGQNSGLFMNNSPFISYQDQMNSITSFASNESMSFLNKENCLIFKGQVGLYPHRKKIIEELRHKICTVSEFLVHERGHRVAAEGNTQYQNPMKNLSKYRYQLVTNGAPGDDKIRLSGTCRAKYMLATGGIVFYVTDGKPRNEWWQHSPESKGLIQYCENTDKLVEKISYFESNLKEASKLSEEGLKFAKEYLHTDNVRRYWKALLEVYKERCEFIIEGPNGMPLRDKQHAQSLI